MLNNEDIDTIYEVMFYLNQRMSGYKGLEDARLTRLVEGLDVIVKRGKSIGWVGINPDGSCKRQNRFSWSAPGRRAQHGPIQVYKSEKSALAYSGCSEVKEVFVNENT